MTQDILQPLGESRQAMLNLAVERYETDGMLDPTLEAFAQRRGLTAETVNTFRLGFVDDPIPGHESVRGYVAIPYLNASGDAVQIRFRCAEDHKCEGHPKYRSESGEALRMFNVAALLSPELELHVCEGEVEAMTLHQLGLAAVGLPGANSWRPRHAVLVEGYRRVYVWGDGDQAGRQFAQDRVRELRNAAPVAMPDGADINSTFVAGGEGAVLDLLEQAKRVFG